MSFKWSEPLKGQPVETTVRVLGFFGCSEGSGSPKFTSDWGEGQRRERKGVGGEEGLLKEEDDSMVTDHLEETEELGA